MFAYSAICDVPEQTLLYVTALLRMHRREIGTRTERRAGTARAQAKLVLRWFRDDAAIRILAAEATLGRLARSRHRRTARPVPGSLVCRLT
ncbi:hypothetical protein [Candidatus Mycobacterium methanotrophicum]|uniref:Transposase n=1 Tax=Candidatus Mycobacterium methanotrophicum TaxID=2943498 RepID=A0ABY4QMB2_9MYCO|nr:hypothetical protein [Candidatus Mycobacterium methanotrophicum]UQX10986.1 hypothetical protein M5I08_24310 [Candidatus Mycobacterium methanotrophicum]